MHKRARVLILSAGLMALGGGCSDDDGGGSDRCTEGQTDCSGLCVNLQDDPKNCGECGRACGFDETCIAGECAGGCPLGQTLCDNTCVNLQTNPDYCGDCETSCHANELCSNGKCAASCDEGLSPCGSSCVDLSSDEDFCGDCNTSCELGQECQSSQCVDLCGEDLFYCGGDCVDTATDEDHCGGCGKACDPGLECRAGGCYPPCDGGLTGCGASCVDTTADEAHCGGCDSPCDPGLECRNSTCVTPCSDSLTNPITDPWGEKWDSTERGFATFATAQAACAAFGGRLPTATELYRVSASQAGIVGETDDTNFLWSLTPYDPALQFAVRLSDGTTAAHGNNTTAQLTYRCLCPDAEPTVFDQNGCYGPAGDPCMSLTSEGGRYNIDRQDRPSLSKGAAIWECAFYRGHLAELITYMEAILSGLPGGSNTWLHTADDATQQDDTLVSWSGVQQNWFPNSSVISTGSLTALRPFRCVGANYSAGTFPGSIADEFVGPTSNYKGEALDSPVSLWAEAHDSCWERGGHLPRATELAELIQQGLPGGTNSWLWTADQVGFNSTDFLTKVHRWSGEQPAFGYYYNDFTTWSYKSQEPGRAYRCIYYPIDSSYAGPAAADCAGGCLELQVGNGPAKLWLDRTDRPAANLGTAVNTCLAAGGHLTSERDLTEAIRQGLPGGTNNWLWTWDFTWGNVGHHFNVVRWFNVYNDFTDLYPADMTWNGLVAQSPYRCVWTNELR